MAGLRAGGARSTWTWGVGGHTAPRCREALLIQRRLIKQACLLGVFFATDEIGALERRVIGHAHTRTNMEHVLSEVDVCPILHGIRNEAFLIAVRLIQRIRDRREVGSTIAGGGMAW